jgi:hypothetical protein
MHCRQLLQRPESGSRKDGATDEQGALQQKGKDEEEEEHAQGGGFEERVQEKAEYAVSCPDFVNILHASAATTSATRELHCDREPRCLVPARLGTAGFSTLESTTRCPEQPEPQPPHDTGPSKLQRGGDESGPDQTRELVGQGLQPGFTGKRAQLDGPVAHHNTQKPSRAAVPLDMSSGAASVVPGNKADPGPTLADVSVNPRRADWLRREEETGGALNGV